MMVENGFTKPLWLVLIVTAHMVFCGRRHEYVNGTVYQNISLHFTFNTTITNESNIAVYKSPSLVIKISEYQTYKNKFEIFPENSSIQFYMTNLSLNNTETYWAVLFVELEKINSNEMTTLFIQERNPKTTVCTEPSTFNKTATSGSSSFYSSPVITIIVVSPFLLFTALLPFLVICLAKPKDQIQEGTQRPSIPPRQETVEVSFNASNPSLVYSVLDFSKRPPSAVEFSPTDTEYATVSYLPEKKPHTCT